LWSQACRLLGTGRKTKQTQGVAESLRHLCSWLGQMRKPFGKDRTRTGRIVTREAAHRQMKLDRASRAGNICEATLILAVDEV
jgi:hypothetical protein